MNRQRKLLTEEVERVGDSRAEGCSAMRNGGRAAVSLPPDVDGRDDGDGRAEGCSAMGDGGQPQCHSCLMLMAQVLLPS